MLGEPVAIKHIIMVAEQGPRAAIAALGDIMRMIGDTTRARRAIQPGACGGVPSD
jgi:hypothetical protein